MKKTITVYVYTSFLMGAFFLPLTASYVTLPNSSLTLHNHSSYTQCSHGNKLTFLGVIRTAARHSLDAVTSGNFIEILNEAILRYDCNRNCKIPTVEYHFLQQCLTQLKTYKRVEHHQFKRPTNEKLTTEELLQKDILYGIALIEAIINPAYERSK